MECAVVPTVTALAAPCFLKLFIGRCALSSRGHFQAFLLITLILKSSMLAGNWRLIVVACILADVKPGARSSLLG